MCGCGNRWKRVIGKNEKGEGGRKKEDEKRGGGR